MKQNCVVCDKECSFSFFSDVHMMIRNDKYEIICGDCYEQYKGKEEELEELLTKREDE
jgi:hypothetical protein